MIRFFLNKLNMFFLGLFLLSFQACAPSTAPTSDDEELENSDHEVAEAEDENMPESSEISESEHQEKSVEHSALPEKKQEAPIVVKEIEKKSVVLEKKKEILSVKPVQKEVKKERMSSPRKISLHEEFKQAPAVGKHFLYVIKKGDSLSLIAKKIFKRASMWKEIEKANTHIVKNDHRIFPGDILRVSLDSEEAKKYNETYQDLLSSHSGQEKIVKVMKGDSLAKIAKKELGDASFWRHIWLQNIEQIHNPNKLKNGMELRFRNMLELKDKKE